MSFQNFHIAAIGEKNRQVCSHQSVAKIACDQIRRDRRIKSPGVSLALANLKSLAPFRLGPWIQFSGTGATSSLKV